MDFCASLVGELLPSRTGASQTDPAHGLELEVVAAAEIGAPASTAGEARSCARSSASSP